MGTGIGAGLVTGGRLHRGAQGCAGDMGHMAVGHADVISRCGQRGCLEALAGGFALSRDGLAAAMDGTSSKLADALRAGHQIDTRAVIEAAGSGDPAARALVTESGRLVGEALSTLVNFVNPSLILLGGRVAAAGDYYLAEVRRQVIPRSLPLATRDLRIERADDGGGLGLKGAAFMAIDAALSAPNLDAATH